MTAPTPPSSTSHTRSADPDRVPGERPPARLPTPSRESSRLARAPGERYAPSAAPTGDVTFGRWRALAIVLIVAVMGGIVLAGLELLDLGAGLLAVGAAIGWTTGLAVRAMTGSGTALGLDRVRRSALAAVVAVVGAGIGFGGIWLWSRTEGGVLGPIDYLADRFGPLPAILLALAAGAAALRAR